MKFVNPRNDTAFKRIFGSEEHQEILLSFLNAVLDLTGSKEIQQIEFLSPLQTPRIKPLRDTLLDLRAQDKRGISFVVEIKVERKRGLRAYLLNDASKTYISQIERGENYPKLDQVIFIGILDFEEFETPHYLTRLQILNTHTYQQEIKDLEFNFIELPKFTKQEEELETVLEKWIYFLKHADELEVTPESANTEALRAVYNIANQCSWTKEELEVYDYWGIKAQDERSAIQFALKTGKQQGIQQERRETARKMLADGLDSAMIVKYTGLSAEEVASLTQEEQE